MQQNFAPRILPSRRRFLGGAAAALAWGQAPGAFAQEGGTLKISQSTALSGPLGELGSAMHQGAEIAFAAVNARGGVHGRRIVLHTLDDAYEVPKALENVKGFLADRENFALFNCMGTPMVQAMLPQVLDSGVPFFAPFTGALLSRVKGARSVFNIRASYADESARLVQHLATIGVKRIAVVYQNNSFGKEVFDGAHAAMTKNHSNELGSATVENDASDAAAAAKTIAQLTPDAVLIGLAGKPALEFVRAFRPLSRGTMLYATSVLATAAAIKALGADAVGLTISQVMPTPGTGTIPVARDFATAWRNAGKTVEPSHLAIEGYINALTFVQALQRAGRNPSREAFIDATWSLKRVDLGGFEVNATDPSRSASNFVELTMIGRNGQFVR